MATTNDVYPLRYQTEDDTAGLYVLAVVTNAANTVMQSGDLGDYGGGLYGGAFAATSPGVYTVTYRAYTDAGHTTLAGYETAGEQIEIFSPSHGRAVPQGWPSRPSGC
jgi:hypothetical protein